MQYGLVQLSNLTVDNFVPLILALFVGLKSQVSSDADLVLDLRTTCQLDFVEIATGRRCPVLLAHFTRGRSLAEQVPPADT